MSAIEIRNLTKNFGAKQAVNGLNMTVPLAFDWKCDSCMSSFLVPLLMPVAAHSAHCNRRR